MEHPGDNAQLNLHLWLSLVEKILESVTRHPASGETMIKTNMNVIDEFIHYDNGTSTLNLVTFSMYILHT